MTTKELLDKYYEGFSKKRGWEDVITDEFKFIGGDMTNTAPVIGKPAYIEIISRFSKLFKSMRVKKMIINGDQACVIGNYDFEFPGEKNINGNVAEMWQVMDGKLDSLTIFFDTLTFDRMMRK